MVQTAAAGLLALVLLCAGAARAQPAPLSESAAWDLLTDKPLAQPASQPAASQPALIPPALSAPALRRPSPASSRRSPQEQLHVDVARASAVGASTGRRMAWLLLMPLTLDLAAMFGYFSFELGRDGGVGVLGLPFTVPIALGSAGLAAASVYGWSTRPGRAGAAGFKQPLARQAHDAGVLRGLGYGLLIGGGIGVGVFGVPVAFSAAGDEVGWSGWTWPAWVGGLVYSSVALVCGVGLHGVGRSRHRTILKRIAVAPLVVPRSAARGLTLSVRF